MKQSMSSKIGLMTNPMLNRVRTKLMTLCYVTTLLLCFRMQVPFSGMQHVLGDCELVPLH
jgi:hypothetical protein